jgi:hypothetical protein
MLCRVRMDILQRVTWLSLSFCTGYAIFIRQWNLSSEYLVVWACPAKTLMVQLPENLYVVYFSHGWALSRDVCCAFFRHTVLSTFPVKWTRMECNKQVCQEWGCCYYVAFDHSYSLNTWTSLHKMQPIQLAFLHFILCRMFLSSLTLYNNV